MAVKNGFVYLVLVGLAILELSAGSQETGINQPAPASINNVRIVGGKKALPGEFPHQLFMELKSRNTSKDFFYCSALILNSAWALTAAHCVDGEKESPERFTLYAGHLSLTKPITGRKKGYKVEAIAVHSEYDNRTLSNDIALMQIKGSFNFSEHVRRAKILMNPKVRIGDTAVISGWGVTRFSGSWNKTGPASDVLRKAKLVVLDGEKCKINFDPKPFDNTKQICAKGIGKQGACSGDSGGPLEINGTVVGIASGVHDKGCGKDYPEGYTRVSAYIDWIKDITSS